MKISTIIAAVAVLIMLSTAQAGTEGEETGEPQKEVPGNYLGDRAELGDLKSFLTLAAENNKDRKSVV